ncbi:MAG: hypothetical protein Kow0069_11270 [Promethearchaeota archaeon]
MAGKEPKLVAYGATINLAYVIVCIVIYAFFVPIDELEPDFYTFYRSGQYFLESPELLYDPSAYVLPFRYLPLTAALFSALQLLPPLASYVAFQSATFACFLGVGKLVVACDREIKGNPSGYDPHGVERYVAFFFAYAPQALSYFCGQTNGFLSLLLVAGLYLHLKGRDGLAGACLGASVLLKPVAILVIPLLLDYDQLRKNWPRFFRQAIYLGAGTVVALAANLVLFWSNPVLLEGYEAINLRASVPGIGNHSSSLTRVLLNLFYSDRQEDGAWIFPLTLVAFYVVALAAKLKGGSSNRYAPFAFATGTLVMLLAYYDAWDHHLLFFAPFLALCLDVPGVQQSKRAYSLAWKMFVALGLLIWTTAYLVVGVNFVTTMLEIITFVSLVTIVFSGSLDAGSESVARDGG